MPFKSFNVLQIVLMLIVVFASRFLNVFVCSALINRSRSVNFIDNKKKLFLCFAGVRGAMAFALSLKSLADYKDKGTEFLAFTLIFSLITV